MIRLFKSSDLESIKSWNYPELSNLNLSDLPETTYVFDIKGPRVIISLILTNLKKLAWLEYLYSDPSLDKTVRKQAVNDLVIYVELVAKNLGYSKIQCMTFHESLSDRYQSLGYLTQNKPMHLGIKELI